MSHRFPDHAQNPYLNSNYAPIAEEYDLEELEVLGSIPKDISGAYFRNGPNPKFEPKGRYHWFDGDGMIHGLYLENGKAKYCNRWVKTYGLKAEEKESKSLWRGLIEPEMDHPISPLKDTSNTDLWMHQGKLLSTWYRCGQVYEVNPRNLQTLGTAKFQKDIKALVASHGKVDPDNHDMMIFNYNMKAPYLCYGVINKSRKVVNWTAIDLPGPRFPHDIAITKNYTIIGDFPVLLNQEALKSGKWRMDFHADMPTRYGIIPRYGQAADVKWIEGKPGYVYHTINAWEDGAKIIMTGCFVDEPVPKRTEGENELQRMIKNLQLHARFYRWVFDLEAGTLQEEFLDDWNTEFPMMNQEFLTKPSRFSYHVHIAEKDTLLFNGLVKYDSEEKTRKIYRYPEGQYCSESPFIPKKDPISEDDGYIISFVNFADARNSEVHLFNAKEIDSGPIAKILIPHHIPAGYHACWANTEEMGDF